MWYQRGRTTPLFPELSVVLSCCQTLQLVRALKSCRLYPRTPYSVLRNYSRHIQAHHTQHCSCHAAFRAEAPRPPALPQWAAPFCVVNGHPRRKLYQQNNSCAEQSKVLYEDMDTACVFDILPQFSPSPSILIRVFHLLTFARLMRPNQERMNPIIFLCLSKMENMAL